MEKIYKLLMNDDPKTYVIAEVSQNHEGSLGQAHAFIDAVSRTGADAIKFQTHIAEEESSHNEPFRVKFSYEDSTRFDYWKRMEFTESGWKGLYEHARDLGLDFLSSPFSIKALEMLDKIGIPAWKFGSGEVFNDILLDKALATGKPIILSTGMSKFEEIDKQVSKIKANGNPFLLMQCTTEYPTSPETVGLNLVNEYKERYSCMTGLSDHSGTIYPSLAAATLGAKAVEVHVTLSKYMFGPDIKSSIDIEQLTTLVEGIHFINKMNHNPIDKSVRDSEKEKLKEIFSKGIYAVKNIKEGSSISENDIALKKPCTGIPSSEYYNILGKKVKHEILKDEVIRWEDINI